MLLTDFRKSDFYGIVFEVLDFSPSSSNRKVTKIT